MKYFAILQTFLTFINIIEKQDSAITAQSWKSTSIILWKTFELFCTTLGINYRILYTSRNKIKNTLKTTGILLLEIIIHKRTFIESLRRTECNFIYILRTYVSMINTVQLENTQIK